MTGLTVAFQLRSGRGGLSRSVRCGCRGRSRGDSRRVDGSSTAAGVEVRGLVAAGPAGRRRTGLNHGTAGFDGSAAAPADRPVRGRCGRSGSGRPRTARPVWARRSTSASGPLGPVVSRSRAGTVPRSGSGAGHAAQWDLRPAWPPTRLGIVVDAAVATAAAFWASPNTGRYAGASCQAGDIGIEESPGGDATARRRRGFAFVLLLRASSPDPVGPRSPARVGGSSPWNAAATRRAAHRLSS